MRLSAVATIVFPRLQWLESRDEEMRDNYGAHLFNMPDQLTRRDINELAAAHEGPTLEYKREFPISGRKR
jgi:hypothetical protein